VALTVSKAVELGDYMETVHGIKPAATAVRRPRPGAVAVAEKPAEKTSSRWSSKGWPTPRRDQRHQGGARDHSLGLKEAKDLVEGAPKPGQGKPAEGRGGSAQEEA